MKPHVKVVGFDTGDGGLTSPSGDGQTITFDSTLTGGTLTIDGTDSANAITVNAASGSGAFTVDSGSTAEIDGLTIGGAVTTSGILTLNGDTNPTANNFSVEVLDGGTLNPPTSIELASLTIDAGGLAQQTSMDTTFGSEVLTVSSLTIDDPSGDTNGGVLDLGNGDMIVRDTDASGIYTLLAAGYDGGAWDGLSTDDSPNPAAIISSAAANDPYQIESLGFAQIGTDTSDGDLNQSTFDGQTVYSGDTVVELTYYGDANLDRTVDGTDYDMIGSVAEPYTAEGYADGYAGWTNGDFIYDGAVTSDDFGAFEYTITTLAGAKYGATDVTIAGSGSASAESSITGNPPAIGTSVSIASQYSVTGTGAAQSRTPVSDFTVGGVTSDTNGNPQFQITAASGTPAGTYWVFVTITDGTTSSTVKVVVTVSANV